MTDLQITLAVLGIVFGGLATWSYRKDQDVQRKIDREREDRMKAVEICHQRVSKAKDECDKNTTKCLDEISIARTESHASVSAARSEFQDRMAASEAKSETSISRVHQRIDEIKRDMVTHEDANLHFARIEDSLGKSFAQINQSIAGLTVKMDTVCSSLARYDERIKHLEIGPEKG